MVQKRKRRAGQGRGQKAGSAGGHASRSVSARGNQDRGERLVRDAEDVERRYYESAQVPSEDVQEVFSEAQRVPRDPRLRERLQDTASSPELSGGDVDAAWERADAGEETVSGPSPTPDQDVVDELGEAVGVSYQDAEPLAIEDKLARRDDRRWELDPASSEDYEERMKEEGRR